LVGGSQFLVLRHDPLVERRRTAPLPRGRATGGRRDVRALGEPGDQEMTSAEKVRVDELCRTNEISMPWREPRAAQAAEASSTAS
jgi:hypothetical protein